MAKRSALVLLIILLAVIPAMPGTITAQASRGQAELQDDNVVFLPNVTVGGSGAGNGAFLTKNVIVLVGDGMGFEHIKAGGMYVNGAAGTLPFENFPYKAQMVTSSAGSASTDSAAAATAMATGVKVRAGTVGLAIPGDGKALYNLVEYARDHKMSTGLVTSVAVTNATPAGFGAHTTSRDNVEEIAVDLLTQTRPNVLFGGNEGMSASQASAAGYHVISDRSNLLSLNTETQTYVSGQFGVENIPYEADGLSSRYPHLSEMADQALDILDNDPDGFFVMIEGGMIDTASHGNNAARMVGEVVEFAKTVQLAKDYADKHPGTLVIVLADHETGGLKVTRNNGAGKVPSVSWSTKEHTTARVGVFVYGVTLTDFPSVIDNTYIPDLITGNTFP